jgi:ubiquinone/menaquinone biosynthesis C-methylase UbiE
MKEILDVCCGGKSFWFDKNHPSVTYCDSRTVDKYEYFPGQFIEIKPDVECDFRNLPFADESFWHIVFDPPHVTWNGETSWMRIKYGVLDSTWPEMIHDGFEECWRVLKTHGTLIFKWSSVQISLSDLLKHIDHEPLYGHRSGRKANTHWLAFVNLPNETHDKPMEMSLF